MGKRLKNMTMQFPKREKQQKFWRKLSLKLKIINILTRKLSRKERQKVSLRKLKKKLGDLVLFLMIAIVS